MRGAFRLTPLRRLLERAGDALACALLVAAALVGFWQLVSWWGAMPGWR